MDNWNALSRRNWIKRASGILIPALIGLKSKAQTLILNPYRFTSTGTIATDSSAPIRFTGTPVNGTNITSASFTPPNSSVLVCCVSADSASSSADITIVVSGGSLTWTNQKERDPGDAGANAGHASIWTAPVSTGASMTVNVQRSAGSGSTNRISAKVYVVTGANSSNPIGTSAEGSSTTNNLTSTAYTSTTNNSRCFGCATDWNALGSPTSTDTADGATYAGAISVISLYKASNTTPSSSSVTANFDAAGTSAAVWNWVTLEIVP